MTDILLLLFLLSAIFTFLSILFPQKFLFFLQNNDMRTRLKGLSCGLCINIILYFLFGYSINPPSKISVNIIFISIVTFCLYKLTKNITNSKTPSIKNQDTQNYKPFPDETNKPPELISKETLNPPYNNIQRNSSNQDKITEALPMKQNSDQKPWNENNTLINVLLCFSAFIPLISLIVLPLLKSKNKKIDIHAEQLESIAENELKKAQEQSARMIRETEDKLVELEHNKAATLTDLDYKIENKKTLVNEIIEQAKVDALKASEIALEERNKKLIEIDDEISKKESLLEEVQNLKTQEENLQKNITSWENKLNRLKTTYKSINSCMTKYLKAEKESPIYQLVHIPEELLSDAERLSPSVTLKLHHMDYKDLRKAFKENDKIIKQVLEKYQDRYVNKTTTAIYKLMVIALQAELQNILYTLTYTKLDEAIANVQGVCKNYLNIAESGNKTISVTLAKFIGEIEFLCVEAIKIEYEYYVKKEAARQEQLALREQMRQEAEERKLLEQQKQQIEKEEQKYKNEIENINIQIQESTDDEKTKQLLEKIKELESQLSDVETKKEDIVNLQNGKAGYVYVISNLGSFGDNVFKVGMTRRLDPQDRVDELGDASVPFKFDVHSFIFSEDAVQLESNLHTALEKNRMNKVNPRKEFFKISIDELENLVDKFDPAAEFKKTMEAEQYRQSLSMEDMEESA